MKAFVAPFHHMKHLCGKPRSGRPGRAAADSSARFFIEMWRAEAVLLWHDRSLVAFTLRSMTKSTVLKPFEFTESDAGPGGVGAVVSDRHGTMLAYTGYRLPWQRDSDNKFQNQREYIGLLIALVLLHRACERTPEGIAHLRHKAVSVQFTGDNTTAQSMIEKEKCKSRGGQLSCMAITWMQVQSQRRVADAAHKEGINMGFVDSLFRFYEIPELDPSLNLSLQDDQAMRALLVQCGPKSAECDLIEHHTAFKRVSEALLTMHFTYTFG